MILEKSYDNHKMFWKSGSSIIPVPLSSQMLNNQYVTVLSKSNEKKHI